MSGAKICPKCRNTYPERARFCPQDATALTMPLESGLVVTHGQAERQTPSAETANAKTARSVLDLSLTGIQLKPGEMFAGKYVIESLLGEGGMARVYLARHAEIAKPVVIKVMHGNLPVKEQLTALKRFEREIVVTANLDHPNLVSVFDGGVIGQIPYLVMEYIKGRSLREFMDNTPKIEFSDIIEILAQVCSGLEEAHNEGVVHRDLKPENIMLREQTNRADWAKVVDFGIAHLKQGGGKLTATGVAVGTVDYMSPEYLSDKPIDHRADIYALGVILFEMVAGRCPFEAESVAAILVKHLFDAPPLLSDMRSYVKPGCALEQIAARALEKEPDNRFQSAAELAQALRKAAANPVS